MRRSTPAALLAACVAGLGLGAPAAGAYTQISTPLGFNPTAIAVSPFGDTAIPIGGVVGRVALPGLVTEADYVNTAGTYSSVVYRPDGREAYVTSSGSDNITVIDVESGQPLNASLASTPACTSQADVAVDAAGSRLAIACDITGSGNGIVQLIATGTFEVLNGGAPALLPFEPRSVVLAPDGSRAYVTAANESKLAIVTLPGGGVTVQTLPGVSRDVAFDPAGTYLFVPAQTGPGTFAVSKIATADFSTTDTLALPDNADPGGVALDPDTGLLYIALRNAAGNGGVAVVDTTAMRLVATIPSGGLGVYDVALDPDATYAYAVRGFGGTAGLARIQLRASAPTNLRASPGDRSATISFDAAFDNQSAIQTYQYSLDDGATWTTPSPARASSPVVIDGLENGRVYTVRLRALNGQPPGLPSATVTVTPAISPPPDAASPAPAAASPTPPSATLRTARARIAGNTIITTFAASGPGRATQIGTVVTGARSSRATGIRACTTTMRVVKAGTVSLTCRLTGKARALRRAGALRVQLVTTFTPSGGTKATSTQTVRLKRR